MKLARRTFLLWGMTVPWLAEGVLAGSSEPLSRFLDLSRVATGFDHLDAELGEPLFRALVSWEPALLGLLQSWPRPLSSLDRAQLEVVDLVISAWYTGAVPTAQGTRVVSYSGALGWACMNRRAPITFCHG